MYMWNSDDVALMRDVHIFSCDDICYETRCRLAAKTTVSSEGRKKVQLSPAKSIIDGKEILTSSRDLNRPILVRAQENATGTIKPKKRQSSVSHSFKASALSVMNKKRNF